MRFLKIISTGILFLAGLTYASKWDESPFMSEAEQEAKAEQTNLANDEATTLLIQNKQFVDPRDNQVYPVLYVDKNLWLNKNLNFKTIDSFCFENKNENCQKTGRLYTWKSAMKACPEGFRLPNRQELNSLAIEESGFEQEALGGYRAFNGDFYAYKRTGIYWTSEQDLSYTDYAFFLETNLKSNWSISKFYKDQANSVRCIKEKNTQHHKPHNSSDPSASSGYWH